MLQSRYFFLLSILLLFVLPFYGMSQNSLTKSSGSGISATSVTFNVNMKIWAWNGDFNPSEDTVFVRGSFNGWSAIDTLSDIDGDSIYSVTLSPGTPGITIDFKFSFFDKSRGDYSWEGDPNRSYTIPSGNSTYEDYYNRDSIYRYAISIKFMCDMSVERLEGRFHPETDSVYVAGDFNDWVQLTDVLFPNSINPDIYEGTVILEKGIGGQIQFNFRYIFGYWENFGTRTYTFTAEDIASGEALYVTQFNQPALSSISGYKFFDVNNNGVKENGEPGLSNWNIFLNRFVTDSTGTTVMRDTIITNSTGKYLFSFLEPGTYSIKEEALPDWVQTIPASPDSYSVSLTGNGNVSGKNFGNYYQLPTSSISGMKFHDANNNGQKDIDEIGLSEWNIFLSGIFTDSVLTDTAGNFSFTNLVPGTYTLSEEHKGNWYQTFPGTPNSYTITLSSGENITNKDFGNILASRTISGNSFHDIDSNGVKDGLDYGLAGMRIIMQSSFTQDTIITDSDGNYLLNNLSSGEYQLYTDYNMYWSSTFPSNGAHYFTIPDSLNYNVINIDFGYFFSAYGRVIQGHSFIDLNGNGNNESEPGLSNRRIRLYKNDIQVDSTLTNSDGAYAFADLIFNATYTVKQKSEPGWISSSPVGGEYTVVIDESAPLTGIDFGSLRLSSISGYKFQDLDNDGIKDAIDPGVASWWIYMNGTRTDSVQTDGNGFYQFLNLTPGSYVITEATSTGTVTVPISGFHNITVTSGSSHTTKNFGYFLAAPKIKLCLNVRDASNISNRNLSWGICAGTSFGIWGVDPQATSKDEDEGEYVLPSPVNNIFDARFVNPRGGTSLFGNGSWTDVRNLLSSYQPDTFKLSFRPGASGYPMTVKWTSSLVASAFNGSVILKDQFGNITDMKTTDSLVVSDSRISSLLLITNSPALTIVFEQGWNTISVPYDVPDGRRTTLFPTANSFAFAFHQVAGYDVRDTLVPGVGYWLKLPEAMQTEPFSGTPRTNDMVNVYSGWNLIGSLSTPLVSSTVTSSPPGIMLGSFFGYNRGYAYADTLKPFRGYWVKVNQDGVLEFDTSETHLKQSISPATFPHVHNLTIKDALGNIQLLYFSNDKGIDAIEMPPPPPTELFDARFASNKFIEVFESEKSKESPLVLSSAWYPVTLSWSTLFHSQNFSLLIDGKEIELKGTGHTQVVNPASHIALKYSRQRELPAEFVLEQNYPNPFNPLTVIRYQLPVQSPVRLSVFNVLGQEVQTLVNEVQHAGFRQIEFDGTGLPSGIYFYKLQAGSYIATKRLLLMK